MRLLALLGLCVVAGAAAQAGPMEPPGTRTEIKAPSLPAPGVGFPPRRVERTGADKLLVPAGFRVETFAEGLDHPRWMALAPNGDVFLAESNIGTITLLRDLDGDGRADLKRAYAIGFNRPHGLAFQPGALYVADSKAVWRLPYKEGDLEAAARRPVTRPGAIGEGGVHWTRNILFAPDGKSFFVTVGSRANAAVEPQPHASVARFALDGAPIGAFAAGLRNPVGISYYPGTNDIYVVVNERDAIGDKLVPDYMARIAQGDFFGWPYAYIGNHPDPVFGRERGDLVARTKIPDLLFEPGSAPAGLVFYDGQQFPESYKGSAFVALHGSWSAGTPAGYKVVRVPFRDAKPLGWYETFVSGFWARGNEAAEIWGRPAGILVARDGSLLIADDTARVIWRVSWKGK